MKAVLLIAFLALAPALAEQMPGVPLGPATADVAPPRRVLDPDAADRLSHAPYSLSPDERRWLCGSRT